MSALYLDNRLVHYEAFGRGQPIIFLHSWFGSWRYWVSTMDTMAEKYRAYAIDFWGFGDSDRNGKNTYTINEYVHMIVAFMDQMGLQTANLVGHGLGGMVAIQAARTHPERFSKLVTVSTPLYGDVLREVAKPKPLTRLLGRSRSNNVWSKVVRQIPIDNDDIQQELYEDTDNLEEHVVESVQQSILNTNLKATLAQLNTIPLLAVYGERDSIVPPEHAAFLNTERGLPQQLLVLPRANHFPFLENSTIFTRLLFDFMVSEGTPVEIKEQWRRRVSQREYL